MKAGWLSSGAGRVRVVGHQRGAGGAAGVVGRGVGQRRLVHHVEPVGLVVQRGEPDVDQHRGPLRVGDVAADQPPAAVPVGVGLAVAEAAAVGQRGGGASRRRQPGPPCRPGPPPRSRGCGRPACRGRGSTARRCRRRAAGCTRRCCAGWCAVPKPALSDGRYGACRLPGRPGAGPVPGATRRPGRLPGSGAAASSTASAARRTRRGDPWRPFISCPPHDPERGFRRYDWWRWDRMSREPALWPIALVRAEGV